MTFIEAIGFVLSVLMFAVLLVVQVTLWAAFYLGPPVLLYLLWWYLGELTVKWHNTVRLGGTAAYLLLAVSLYVWLVSNFSVPDLSMLLLR